MQKKFFAFTLALLIVISVNIYFAGHAAENQSAKGDSYKTKEEITWENFGADIMKNAPQELINGTDLDKAKYIMSKTGNQLNNHGLIPNTSYVDRQVLGGEKGTCGDVSNKLSYALKGAGIKNTYLFGEKSMSIGSKIYRAITDPLDVNPDHGGIVIYSNGNAYMFDLWAHGVLNKSFHDIPNSEWNGMTVKEWESRMKKAGYVDFSTLSKDNEYGGKKYNNAVDAVKNFIKSQLPKIPEEIRIDGNSSWEGIFLAEKTLQFDARIVYSKPAGGNWPMEVLLNGQTISSALLNKAQNFKYKDGRTFSYLSGNGTSWMLFYSPNFSANNSTAGGGYQVLTNPGEAYRYKWDISSFGQDLLTIKVRIVNNGNALGNKIVIRGLIVQ
ncbi:MAG: hypothetical protein HYU63_00735 [Armatimonadetes bacterium]|nr:hypothetical protein [Armatimonadota bacterium]